MEIKKGEVVENNSNRVPYFDDLWVWFARTLVVLELWVDSIRYAPDCSWR
jgi:hypothetical protein